jgi:hypothetical protein
MGDHCVAVVQVHDQKLPVATDLIDGSAPETAGDLRLRSIVTNRPIVTNRDFGDRAAGHRSLQVSACDLNFGQLGQSGLQVRADYGTEPMQIVPRPFGQVLGDAMNALARTWQPLMSAALWAFIPAGVAALVVFRLSDAEKFLNLVFNDPGYLDSLTTEELVELATPFLWATLIAVLLQVLASVFVYLASHHVIANDAAGFKTTGADARRVALNRYGAGLFAGLIVFLAIAGVVVAGLVAWTIPWALVGTPNATSVFIAVILMAALMTPAVWLGVTLSMWSSVLVVERRGAIRSLRRSLELVRGRWWPTFGFLLLVGLLGSVAIQLIQLVAIPLSVVGDLGIGISIASLIGLVAQGLIVAAIAAMYTTWYVDLRAREGDLAKDDLL